MNGETGELPGMPRQLGSRYLLGELIGRGGMGRVYAGTDRGSGEPVAIKVLRPELVSDPDAVARFLQERQILTSISSPATVRIIDLVAEGETLAIVMELVNGQDLRRYLRARTTLPPAEAVGLAIQLLNGLAIVHAAGVVHRDIKPENLLLDAAAPGAAAGEVTLKVTDFGVARLSHGTSLTKLSSVIGTPEYIAPELVDGGSATPAADLYSAGIVLYEMLSGRTPFAGGSLVTVLRRHADMAPPSVPGLPPALWEPLARMMAKDPAARPASASAAAAALSVLSAELAPLPALPPQDAPASYQRVTAADPAPAGPEHSDTATIVRQHELVAAAALPHSDAETSIRNRGLVAPAAFPGSEAETVIRNRAPAGPAGTGTVTRPAPSWRLPALLAGVAAVVFAAAVLIVPKVLRSPAPPSPTLTTSGAAATTAAATTASSGDGTSSAAAPTTAAPATTAATTAAPATTAPTTAAPATTAPTTAAPVTTPPTTAAPVTTPPAQAVTTTAPPPAGASFATSGALSTSGWSFSATGYFGQVSAVEAALGGQVTFNPLTTDASDPAACVETVVFFNTGYTAHADATADGLGSGWRPAETLPINPDTNGDVHQQLVAPPLGVATGTSYAAGATFGAQLVSGVPPTSTFSLSLQSTAGSVQTWLVNGQAVSCDG